MKTLTRVCVILAIAIFSGCGLTTPSDRQEQTNRRLDQIHRDLQQLRQDLPERTR